MSTYLKPEADRLFVEGLTPTSSDQAWGQTRLGLLPIKVQNLGDADATIAAGTTFARLTATLTGPRTYSLPSPVNYPTGTTLIFSDVNGQLNTTNYATLYAGAATINGASSRVINIPYASPILNSNGLNAWVSDFNPPEYGYVLVKQGNNVKKFESSADTNAARMDALKKALQYAQLTPSSPAVAELSQGNFGITSGFPLSTYASNVNIKFNEGSAVIYANPDDATADSGFYEGPRNVLNFGALPTFDDFNAGATAVDCLSAIKAAYNSLPISPGSYDSTTGRGVGETPPPNKGDGTGYTTTAAGFAVSATSIPIIAGTGNVLVGDIITFNGDGNQYTVTAGVSAPGTITIASPGLKQAIPPTATKMYIKGAGTPLRIGIIYFPQSSAKQSAIYYISDTWYISAFTNLIGENKYIYINFKNNVATVSEKFVVYMLSNESNGPGAANTFAAYINNICISGNRSLVNGYNNNNPYSSGLRFSCAQRGTIGFLGIYECGLRGFVTDINGGSVDVGYLNVEGVTRGPGISLNTCYSFAAKQVVCSFINNNQWAKDSDGDYYPSLYAENCRGININAFQAEEVSTGVRLKNCTGVFMPITSTSKYLRTITNVTSGNPIIITSDIPAGLEYTGHGRSTGDKVTIFGVTGIPNANVTNVAISAIDFNRFALSGVSGSGTYISGGQYLPGNNTGVIVTGTDNYELGLDVAFTSYAFVDRGTGQTILGNKDSLVTGRYSWVARLDNRVTFINAGVVKSETSNITIAAPQTLTLQTGTSVPTNTTINTYPLFGSYDNLFQLFSNAGSNSIIEGSGATDSLCIGTGADKPVYIKPNRVTTATFASTSINLSLAAILTADPGTGSPGTLWRSGNDLKIATATVVQPVTGLLGNAFPAWDTGADSGTLSSTAFSSVFYSSGGTIRFSGSRPVSAGLVELFAMVDSGGYSPGPTIYDSASALQVRFRNLSGGDIINYNLAARTVPDFDIVIDWSSTDTVNRHKVWLNGVLQTAAFDSGLNPYSTQNQLRWGEANLSVKHLAYYSTRLGTPLVLGSLANLAVAPMADTLSTTLPLSVGGTGSTTASGARVNLGLGLSSSPIFASLSVTSLSAVNGIFSNITVTNNISSNTANFTSLSAVNGTFSNSVSSKSISATSITVNGTPVAPSPVTYIFQYASNNAGVAVLSGVSTITPPTGWVTCMAEAIQGGAGGGSGRMGAVGTNRLGGTGGGGGWRTVRTIFSANVAAGTWTVTVGAGGAGGAGIPALSANTNGNPGSIGGASGILRGSTPLISAGVNQGGSSVNNGNTGVGGTSATSIGGSISSNAGTGTYAGFTGYGVSASTSGTSTSFNPNGSTGGAGGGSIDTTETVRLSGIGYGGAANGGAANASGGGFAPAAILTGPLYCGIGGSGAGGGTNGGTDGAAGGDGAPGLVTLIFNF